MSREAWDAFSQSKRLQAPLQPEDELGCTWGCRHSNPAVCGKHRMPKVCAFVREDGRCLAPPRSWPKQHSKLLAERAALLDS